MTILDLRLLLNGQLDVSHNFTMTAVTSNNTHTVRQLWVSYCNTGVMKWSYTFTDNRWLARAVCGGEAMLQLMQKLKLTFTDH